MAAPSLKALAASIEKRQYQERLILLVVGVMLVIYAWVLLVNDRVAAARAEAERQMLVATSQIAEEITQQTTIRASYSENPNEFAQNRQQELSARSREVDMRLDELYGELISPQQMSLMLTSILRRETMLELVSLENQPSELLVDATPSEGPEEVGSLAPTVRVYKHGLRMVFEGDYLETVRYLRSLEELESNFFWENLEFELKEYPKATISLDIYTLSTQKGWIGV